ncbi:hypothetical protein LC574_08540 [Nostoc sp. CHAB 5715]|nr:hypothetical protein [Nostoc sp. CHAB 5715]
MVSTQRLRSVHRFAQPTEWSRVERLVPTCTLALVPSISTCGHGTGAEVSRNSST